MKLEPVQFDEASAKRIAKATRRVEDLGDVPPGLRPPAAARTMPNIRAVLLEPLASGGIAKAERTIYDTASLWFDVCVLGYPTTVESTFKLILSAGNEPKTSTDIRLDATAADLASALDPWDIEGRVSVGFGKRGDLITGRWSVGLKGPFPLPAAGGDVAAVTVAGSIAGSAGMVVVRSRWKPTGEIIEVIEGGLMLQDIEATPLRPGAAVHATYHNGAGYVVHAAEARKFSTIFLLTDDGDYY